MAAETGARKLLDSGRSTDGKHAAYQYLLKYLPPFKGLLCAGVIAGVLDICCQLLFPLMLRYLVDFVFIQRHLERLGRTVLILIAAAAATVIIRTIQRHSFAALAAGAASRIRADLLRHLRALPLASIYGRRAGDLMSLFTSDVPVLSSFYENIVGESIIGAFRLVVTVAVLWIFLGKLGLIGLVLAPVYLLLPSLSKRGLRRAGEDVQDANATLCADLQESISAARDIKLFDRAEWDRERIRKADDKLYRSQIRQSLWQTTSSTTYLIYWIVTGVTYWIGGKSVASGTMTVGSLIAAVAFLTYIEVPINNFVRLNSNLQAILAASDRILGLLHTKVEHAGPEGTLVFAGCHRHIRFRSVTFGYTPENPVLKDVDFSLPAGQRTAIVGASGAGKTTLVNLLLRLYEPDRGQILIDGQDLQLFSLESIRKKIGTVFHDSFLFHASIEENIKFGHPDVSDEEIAAAASAAMAHDFIMELPQQYKTVIGDRGVTLSAGQRQRVLIARMILLDPEIIILDEATSTLDSESEQCVQEALGILMQGRTTIVIAHRLSTIINADSIVVIEDGRVRAVDEHEKLLESCATYRKLYAAQTTI
ncbi:MAG TPA: ABC transporter ATP-binding protein [Candidatus Angelobacter sp.]|nr:ABC transporter ATP-binding protein [Candidatus Angelobacter sp.]